LTFFSLYYAVFTMLPFPKLDGTYLFFATRNWYFAIFFFLLGYIILYSLGFYSLIFAAVIGGIGWLVYYVVFEKDAWKFG